MFFARQQAKMPKNNNNAKNALNKMFGKNIASGNNFKQTFGSTLNNSAKFNTNMFSKPKPKNKGFVQQLNNKKTAKKLKQNMSDGKVKKKTKQVARNFLKMIK